MPQLPSDSLAPSSNEYAVLTRLVPPSQPPSGLISYGVSVRLSNRQSSYGLRVQHELPPGVKLVRSEPPAQSEQGQLLWSLGDFEAGKELRIQVVVEPQPGVKIDPSRLTSFQLVYNSVLHVQTPVVKTDVELRVSEPGDTPVGGMVQFQVHVRNAGNSLLEGANLEVTLPSGVFHPNGSQWSVPIRRLKADESEQVEFCVRAESPGEATLSLACAGRKAERSFRLVAAALEAEIESPELIPVGELLSGSVVVRNAGTAAAEQVLVLLTPPLGGEFVEGESTLAERSWIVPLVRPGESVRLPFRARADVPVEGQFQLRVSASDSQLLIERGVTFEVPKEAVGPLEGFLRGVASRMAPAARPARTDSAAPSTPYIVFVAARTAFAVPLAGVVEVSRALAVTPVPNLPAWLLGIANLRGDMVSVMSLGQFFGQESESNLLESKAMVLKTRTQDVVVAVVVDEVLGLRTLDQARIREFPTGVEHPAAEFAVGVADLDDRLVVVFDVDRLLTSPSLSQFQGV